MAIINLPNSPIDGQIYVNPEEPNVAYRYNASTDLWEFADNSAYRNAILFNGQPPSYYLDYNNFTNNPVLVTKTSELINDSGFIISETDTLDDVTSRGAVTTNDITVGQVELGGSLSLSSINDLASGTDIDLSLGNVFNLRPSVGPTFQYTFSNLPATGFHRWFLFVTPTLTLDLEFPFLVLIEDGLSLTCDANKTTVFELIYNGSFYINKIITNSDSTPVVFSNPEDTFGAADLTATVFPSSGPSNIVPYNNVAIAVDFTAINTDNNGLVFELGGSTVGTAMAFNQSTQEIVVVAGQRETLVPDEGVRIEFSVEPFLGRSGTFIVVCERGTTDTVTVYWIEGGSSSGNPAFVCGTESCTIDRTSTSNGWWGINQWGFGAIVNTSIETIPSPVQFSGTGTIDEVRVWYKDDENVPLDASVTIPNPFQTIV